MQVPAAGGQAGEQPHPDGDEEDPRLGVEEKRHPRQILRLKPDGMREHPRKAEADPGLMQQIAEDAAGYGATAATARNLRRGDNVGHVGTFNQP